MSATNLVEYAKDPFKHDHAAYEKSIFDLKRAPHLATGEVLLASTYRALGLAPVSEDSVKLEKIDELPAALAQVTDAGRAAWDAVLGPGGALRSPTPSGRRNNGQPLPQLAPLVPAIAQHAGVLGRANRRPFMGHLVVLAVMQGAGLQDHRVHLERLRNALDVTSEDDVFARFLQDCLLKEGARAPRPWGPDVASDPFDAFLSRERHAWARLTPPERMVRDIDHLVRLKSLVTRRQWTSLVEAVLRVGTGTYVLWMFRANVAAWRLVQEALDGRIATRDDVQQRLFEAHYGDGALLTVGEDSTPALRDILEQYALARFGLNALLFRLADAGAAFSPPSGAASNIDSVDTFRALLAHAHENRARLAPETPARWLADQARQILDENAPQVALKRSGTLRNCQLFVNGVLRQLKPSEPSRAEYDQAFCIASRKRRWRVQLGPVTLLALAYACCSDRQGRPVTLDDFAEHLAMYGIRPPREGLVKSDVVARLEQLGVIIDSPDATGGRVLVNPFRSHERSGTP